MVGTYLLSIERGSLQSIFKGYNNVPCVLYSLGIFVLLKDISKRIEKIDWIRNTITVLGKYTFEVYLIHWYIIIIFNDMFEINTKSIFYRLLFPYSVYVIVIAIVWCMRKIPLIRDIVP